VCCMVWGEKGKQRIARSELKDNKRAQPAFWCSLPKLNGELIPQQASKPKDEPGTFLYLNHPVALHGHRSRRHQLPELRAHAKDYTTCSIIINCFSLRGRTVASRRLCWRCAPLLCVARTKNIEQRGELNGCVDRW